jgi:histidine triad (HIT) family protein
MEGITIFEKIINRQIPAEIVYEDENVLAFRDIYPQAPIHLLFIHKEKTTNAIEMAQKKSDHLIAIFNAIAEYAKQNKLDQAGLRIVSNVGSDGGQTVFYTHFHVLAGTKLKGFGA